MFEATRNSVCTARPGVPAAASYLSSVKPFWKLDSSVNLRAAQGVWRGCASDRRDMFEATRIRLHHPARRTGGSLVPFIRESALLG